MLSQIKSESSNRNDPVNPAPEGGRLLSRFWAMWTKGRIFWGLFGLSLGFQALIYTVVTNKPVIRSDGVGYQSYLPAVLADHDLSFATLRQREFPKGIPYWTGIHHGPRAYVIKYPLGVALLESPFFVVAQGVGKIAGYKSVYAWPYQAAAAVSAAFYFGLGGMCVWILLRRQFAPPISLVALLLTVFGTNLLHYATYDAAFSHVYSFFLVAALLVVSGDLYHASARRWLGFGLLAGLTVVTRPTNGIFVLFALADWVMTAGSWREALRRLRHRWQITGAAVLLAAAPVGLQFLYWRVATGHWFYYTYINEGFNFFGPAGLRVLFGFEKGWFVYAPLVGLATFGWVVARRHLAPDARVVLPFVLLNLWIISSWHDWGYGGAFSMRPLVESSPLVALGVAGALWRAWPVTWARRLGLALGLLCAIYTTILMVGYWTHALPYIQATRHDIYRCLIFDWPRD